MYGIGLRNQPDLAASDYDQIAAATFSTVKAFWYQNMEQVKRTGLPVLLRLPDSERLVSGHKIVPSPQDYAGECATWIKQWQAAGVVLLGCQIDCEPNEQSFWGDEGKWRDNGEWRYQDWYREVVKYLRPQVPGVRLGLPPVSTRCDIGAWYKAAPLAAQASDFVVVDAYWQNRAVMFHPSFGGQPQAAYAAFGKGIVLGEWGSSLFQNDAGNPDRLRMWSFEYLTYMAWLQTLPYVEAAYIYIQNGTPDWAGFHPPNALYPLLAGNHDRLLPFTPQTPPVTPYKHDGDWLVGSDFLYHTLTRHYLRGPILRDWSARNGIVFDGLPISDPFVYTKTGLITQFFERSRLEVQPSGVVTRGLIMVDLYNGGTLTLP